MKMPYQLLGEFIADDEQLEAKEWVASLDDYNLLGARFKNYSLANWVKSSVHSHFRTNKIDFSDPSIVEGFRSYLYSGSLALVGLSRALDTIKPDVLFLFNGRLFSHRIAFELARSRDIPVVVHERGARDNSISIWQNEICHDLKAYDRSYHEWKSVPLSTEELEQADLIIRQRRKGRNTGFKAFGYFGQSNHLSFGLKRSPEINLAVLWLSSIDEVVASNAWVPVMEQVDLVNRSIAFFRDKPNWKLVIKSHPNTVATGVNRESLLEIQRWKEASGDDYIVVMPDDSINSYELIEHSNCNITYCSTIGLEAACMGKPVLCCGGGFLFGRDYALNLERSEDLESCIEDLISMQNYQEIRRKALRFAHFHFVFRSPVFPLLKQTSPHTNAPTYSNTSELMPGKCDVLDRICEAILNDKPFYPQPMSIHYDRDSQAEDSFLTGTKIELAGNHSSLAPLHQGKKPQTPIQEDSSRPLISVVIPCYNYAEYLETAVLSVVDQTFKDCEIIIVNDGSTDNSLEVAQDLQSRLSIVPIIVLNQANSGQPAAARNAGIAHARGTYIICLDADDCFANTMLFDVFSLFQADPRLSLVYTDALYVYEDGQQEIKKAGRFSVPDLKVANQFSYTAMYTKALWQRLGGYRLNIRGYEDWDFWLAAALAGTVAGYVPKPLLIYNFKDGLWRDALRRDRELRATLVTNNQSAFDASQLAVAQQVLSDAHLIL